MSKADAQRAMREARFAERQRDAATRPAAPAAATPVAAKKTPARARPPLAVVPDAPAPATVPTEERSQDVCGHRSMNGRTCTRESGHEQKNHRYS